MNVNQTNILKAIQLFILINYLNKMTFIKYYSLNKP